MESTQTENIGNYRVIAKLGQGGMGAVYKAVQGTLERPCALKLLPPELSSNHEYVQRFLREARSVAQLRHENIVQVYDAGQEGNRYFIAMELVDGTDLQTHIEKKGTVTEADGLALLLQAAKGLAAAHAKGLVHRDIKPHNLLMSNDGVLRIVDFGLVMESSSTTQLTATGACLGTPMYMSPEQADGEQADARTDVYSLGITFFRVFTGQLPFNSNTVMNLLFKHKFEAPPDPHKVRPDLSENVRRLLLHMIAKRREDRPQDGSKIVEMIESIQAGKKLPPPPVYAQAGATSILMPQGAESVTPSSPAPRAPWPLIGIAAAVVVVVILAVFVFTRKGTDPRIAQAQAEFQAGRYKEAQQLYQQALTADPQNAALKERVEESDRALRVAELLTAAKALEAANDLPGASARYNDAAALDNTGKARAEVERVRALLDKNQALSSQQRDAERDRYSKAASEAEKAGQFETAAEHYSRAASLAENPLKAVLADKAQECRRQDYLGQALKEEKRGNLAEAELFYRRALDIKRDGLVEEQLAELQKKKSQSKAAALEPTYDAAMRDGQRALEAGDYPNARKKFKDAMAVKANDAVAANKLKETDGRELITRGDTLRAQGRKDDAVAAYTEAIQKWPPLGIEATQRIQAATVNAPVKPAPNTNPVPVVPVNPVTQTTPAVVVNPQPIAPVTSLILKLEGYVREKRDNEALQELLNGLKAYPGNRELTDTKDGFDNLQGALGVYAELQKIVESGKLRVSETMDVGEEARIRETGEKLESQQNRNVERSDEARSLFIKKDYNGVKGLLRSARNDAGDMGTELAAAASYLEQRADKAGEGSGIKLPFGGVRLGTSGDKKKAERFRNAGEGFRRLSEQARAQAR